MGPNTPILVTLGRYPRARAGVTRVFAASIRQYSTPVDSSIPDSKRKFIPTSGSYPAGFRVSGTHAGVKPSNKTNPDIAIVSSDVPCSAAAVFTTNKFQAAPVQVSKQIIQTSSGRGIRAVVANAGCANAVTGKGGLEDAKKMSMKVDECNGIDSTGENGDSKTLVMSTGVIGQRYVTNLCHTL